MASFALPKRFQNEIGNCTKTELKEESKNGVFFFLNLGDPQGRDPRGWGDDWVPGKTLTFVEKHGFRVGGVQKVRQCDFGPRRKEELHSSMDGILIPSEEGFPLRETLRGTSRV